MLELSEQEIEMLSYCIESAIDIKQMNKKRKYISKSNFKTIKKISL